MRDTGVVHFHHDHLLQGFAHHNSHYFKTTDSYLYKNVSDNLETQACVYLTNYIRKFVLHYVLKLLALRNFHTKGHRFSIL